MKLSYPAYTVQQDTGDTGQGTTHSWYPVSLQGGERESTAVENKVKHEYWDL